MKNIPNCDNTRNWVENPEIRFEVCYPRDNLSRLDHTRLALPKGVELKPCYCCDWDAPMINYGFDGKELLMDIYCEKCNFEVLYRPWRTAIEDWNEEWYKWNKKESNNGTGGSE